MGEVVPFPRVPSHPNATSRLSEAELERYIELHRGSLSTVFIEDERKAYLGLLTGARCQLTVPLGERLDPNARRSASVNRVVRKPQCGNSGGAPKVGLFALGAHALARPRTLECIRA